MQNTIIIAEDNAELSDMMKNYLEQAGYIVHQAFDGGEVLKIARKFKPDLVLLDIMMPVLDGYQVCPALRVLGNFPIIIVSAKILEEEKLKMFELGADDYITKPFSFKEMWEELTLRYAVSKIGIRLQIPNAVTVNLP